MRSEVHLSFYQGAQLLTIGAVRDAVGPMSGGGTRERVSSFSHAARLRMMRKCATLKRRSLKSSIFVTLTYPASWSSDPSTWKLDLDRFLHALKRAYPRGSAIWRLEAQERGAPHFHLLVLGVRFIPHEWTAATWTRIVGGDADHLKAGTETRRARSVRQAVAYVSKYAAKLSDHAFRSPDGHELSYVGRHWGYHNKAHLPLGDLRWYSIPASDREALIRFCARRRGGKYALACLDRPYQSCSFFDHRPEDCLRFCNGEWCDRHAWLDAFYLDNAMYRRLLELLAPLLRPPPTTLPAENLDAETMRCVQEGLPF